MSQLTLDDFSDSGHACHVCGETFSTNRGVGVHGRKKHGDDYYTTPECDHCGGELDPRPPSDVRETMFCDQACRDAYWAARRVSLTCDHCGDELDPRPPGAAGRVETAFCDEDCQYAYQSGTTHPYSTAVVPWDGSGRLTEPVRHRLSSRSWERISAEYRDGIDECEKCGDAADHLQTHHIIPIRAGGTNGEWNLMALCRACHRRVDHYTYAQIVDVVLVE